MLGNVYSRPGMMSVLEHQDILQVVELRAQQAEIKALQLENEVIKVLQLIETTILDMYMIHLLILCYHVLNRVGCNRLDSERIKCLQSILFFF